jgi:molybdopterin synthase sulfur carrier subunit
MAVLVFANAFRRHVDCPDAIVDGDDVAAVLTAYFADHPEVRGYVLDDLGAVRSHVAVFVDGDLIGDRATQSDPVDADGTVHIFQALSGG